MTGARGNVKRRKESNAKGSTNRESKNGERIRIDQQYLPGIPDDLTLAKISPHFSWTVLNNLIGVSHGWRRLIQSRQLFEARKLCGREETAFVYRVDGRVHGNGSKHPLLALFSIEDCSVCYLPQIPCFTASTRIRSFTYTSSNGKLYVMASFEEQAHRMARRRCTYVYDLAGHIGWKRCTDPKFVSRPEQSAVMNGKIFVCGHTDTHLKFSNLKCAIYDPEDDAWLPIKIGPGRRIEVLAGLRENKSLCFLTAPTLFHRFQWLNNSSADTGNTPCFFSESSMFGPLHKHFEWIKASKEAAVTVMNGRFLKMTEHGLDIYDSHTSTWTPLHFESPESNSTVVENLTAAGLRYRLYTGKNPLYSKRTLDVAVISNVVYSLEELRFPVNNHVEQTLRIHLYRREAVVRDSHRGGLPLREKYDPPIQKLVTLLGSCKCNEILKCPVQL